MTTFEIICAAGLLIGIGFVIAGALRDRAYFKRRDESIARKLNLL